MKNSLLILAGAAALSLASCSQEKTIETTTTPADGMTTTTTTTTTAPMSEADMEARAQRIADKMVADMKITDEAIKTKIRTVYVNRYKRMNEMQTKYATDTTGMGAARREAMMATDAEFKTVFTDPAQYKTYETGRMSYYEMENQDQSTAAGTDDINPSTMTDASTAGDNTGAGAMSGNDVGKVKVKADGDIKIKDADGNKTKIDGDDGTVKTKLENGEKSKLK